MAAFRCLVRGVAGNRQTSGQLPLIAAARNGHIGILEILLGHAAEVELQGPARNSPLTRSLETRRDAAAELLLKRCATPDFMKSHSQWIMLQAAKYGLPGTLRLLLDHGDDPNYVDEGDRLWNSPLLLARRRSSNF